jgi:hypothetical protein
VRDGVSPVFVSWSYLRSAARERVVARPNRRLAATLAATLVGATLIGVPLVLLDSLTPANAASRVEVIALISNRNDAAGQLESVFRSHHFNIGVEEEPSPPSEVGSILAVESSSPVVREIPGRCIDGTSGCIDGITVPVHYNGRAKVFIGRRAKNGETDFGSPTAPHHRGARGAKG